ncbi:hypothetical protein VFPPC_15469 [Pochonia chlamydosporia 170]|uniref:Uncharacterized protein n=1 Tax=Pochonia chlamydosporia 170 TaxID=1380566 RepID=A0A179FVL4_METCM|nr:hypothetical protein VFPPC_15469 [Pochonia chlamydosporia 170]OAQ69695.1 hypothetical protein VFPPC_15469 [Pochonia chlamydosporia 170]
MQQLGMEIVEVKAHTLRPVNSSVTVWLPGVKRRPVGAYCQGSGSFFAVPILRLSHAFSGWAAFAVAVGYV